MVEIDNKSNNSISKIESKSKFIEKIRKEIYSISNLNSKESDSIDSIIHNYNDICYLRNIVLKGGYNSFRELSIDKSSDFNHLKNKDLVKLWRSPQWKLLVYISSTHVDFSIERSILMDKILPLLKEIGYPYQIEVSFIDMCWGYKQDDLLLNHRNFKESEKAINYCYDESDGIFFISLLSSKYGECLLPKFIAKTLFESKINIASSEIKELALKWYKLDDTLEPPLYMQSDINSIQNDIHLSTNMNFADAINGLSKLVCQFDGITFEDMLGLSDQDDFSLKVGGSIVDYEIKTAISLASKNDILSDHNILCTYRDLVSLKDLSHLPFDYSLYTNGNNEISSNDKIDHLKSFVSKYIPKDDISEYQVTIQSLFNKYIDLYNNSSFILYENLWEDNIQRKLISSLNNIIMKRKLWFENGYGIGIKGELLNEMLYHHHKAYIECKHYLEVDNSYINTAMSYILNRIDNTTSLSSDEQFSGITLCITGLTGSGKSGFMAKLGDELFKYQQKSECSETISKRSIIIRFCSSNSSCDSLYTILSSICHQIKYLISSLVNIPTNIEELICCFQDFVRRSAIVVLLDGLDLLKGEIYNIVSFFKGLKLHPLSIIIISYSSNSSENSIGYSFQNIFNKSKIPKLVLYETDIIQMKNQMVVSDKLMRKDLVDRYMVMIKYLNLNSINKKYLTNYQLKGIEKKVESRCNLFYSKLITFVFKTYSHNSHIHIENNLNDVINQIFDSIESRYGMVFTKAVLGIITFSVNGVSDEELLDLLSINNEVINSLMSNQNKKFRLPNYYWIRIRGELVDFLTVNNGFIKWNNAIIENLVKMRFKKGEIYNLHCIMALYYGDLLSESILKEKKVICHKPYSMFENPFHHRAILNKRRCEEAIHHMLETNLIFAAEKEICCIIGLWIHLRCDKLSILREQIVSLISKVNSIQNLEYNLKTEFDSILSDYFTIVVNSIRNNKSVSNHRINSYLKFLEQNFDCLITNNSNSLSVFIKLCLEQPLSSIVRYDMMQLIEKKNFFSPNINFSTPSLLRCLPLGNTTNFPSFQYRMNVHLTEVNCASWNNNGTLIASCAIDSVIIIWNTKFYSIVKVLNGHKSNTTFVQWSPTEHHILVSCSFDQTILIWDTSTGHILQTIEGHTAEITSVCWSFDGLKLCSSSYDFEIKVWELHNPSAIALFNNHTAEVNKVKWSPINYLIAGISTDDFLIVWDSSTDTLVLSLTDHGIIDVAWNSDAQSVISASSDGSIKVWSCHDGSIIKRIDKYKTSISCISLFQQDDVRLLLAAYVDNSIKLWDLKSCNELDSISAHDNLISHISWSCDGKSFSTCSHDGSVILWNYFHGFRGEPVECHADEIFCIHWSYCENFIITGSSDNIRLWDSVTMKCLGVLSGHENKVSSIAFSPSSNTTIASGSFDRTIKLWDTTSKTCINTLNKHTAEVTCVVFCPGGSKLASTSVDEIVMIWDMISYTLISKLEGHVDTVSCIDWSPDGLQLASSSGEYHEAVIKIWDVESSHMINTLTGHKKEVVSVAWASDSVRLISTGRDNVLRIWDVETGSVIKGHSDVVTCVKWSHDSSLIASSSYDGTIRVWNGINGSIICILDGKVMGNRIKCRYNCLSWSPDSLRIAAGSNDGKIHIWDNVNII